MLRRLRKIFKFSLFGVDDLSDAPQVICLVAATSPDEASRSSVLVTAGAEVA